MTTTTSMWGKTLALLLALMLAMPATVWAQDAVAQAAEYYDQATQAYQQGDYEEAARLLDLAYGANPAELVYKYNRILALQALGRYELALSELNSLYTGMKADKQKRFDDIDDIKAQLEAAIAAKKSNENPDPDPDPDPNGGEDPNALTDPGPATDDGETSPAPYILLGAGGAMVVTGVLFVGAVFLPADVKECLGINNNANCESLVDKLDLEGPDPRTDARDRAESVRKTHVAAAVSLMAAGAVVGGIGLVLLLTGNKSSTESSEAPMSAGFDSLRVSPYFTHEGGGAALQFRF